MTTFITKKFSELSLDELYDALKLRIDVFVVEQTCYYPDIDNLDRHPETLHIFSYDKNSHMNTYLRVLPKGLCYEKHIAIGRVIVSESSRGKGIGHQLLEKTINICQGNFKNQSIKISAQEHLAAFYQHHGFKKCSEMYLEDGIPHIAMTRN